MAKDPRAADGLDQASFVSKSKSTFVVLDFVQCPGLDRDVQSSAFVRSTRDFGEQLAKFFVQPGVGGIVGRDVHRAANLQLGVSRPQKLAHKLRVPASRDRHDERIACRFWEIGTAFEVQIGGCVGEMRSSLLERIEVEKTAPDIGGRMGCRNGGCELSASKRCAEDATVDNLA